jgi:hypothetical protein
MAGEMEASVSQDDTIITCYPFRLTALDMALALIFGDNNYDNPKQITLTRGLTSKSTDNTACGTDSEASKTTFCCQRLWWRRLTIVAVVLLIVLITSVYMTTSSSNSSDQPTPLIR